MDRRTAHMTMVLLASGCSMPSAPSYVPHVVTNPISFIEASAGTPAQPLSSLSTITSTLIPPQDGWASVTGYRNAETSVQRRIVQNAIAADGQSSGESVPGDWNTDADNDDGQRMRSAVNLLAASTAAQQRDVTVIQSPVLQQMKAQLATHDARRQQMIVDRMVDRWRFWSKLQGPPAIQFPLRDDRQLLSFMGIRRQCLEWVDTIAVASGGRPLNWLSPGVPLYAARPGMGMFDGGLHATIIIDVDWRGGAPARFRVAEANWGSDWMDPLGQIPWQRTVIASRIVPAGHKVASFE